MSNSEPLRGLRRHNLLTAELRKALPAIRSTDGQGKDAIAHVKLFNPYNRYGTLYITEFDGEDELYGYGSLFGPDWEWGYASFDEIARTTFRGRVPAIERDRHWEPRPIRDCDGVS